MNLAAVGRRYIGSESLEKSSRKNILISKIPADKALLDFSQARRNSSHKNESDSVWWELRIAWQVPFLTERSVHGCSAESVDYSLAVDSSVYGISWARILEWVAISFSRGSSRPRDWTCISWIGRWILYYWANWEAHALTCLCAICLWCRNFILHYIFYIHIHQDPV